MGALKIDPEGDESKKMRKAYSSPLSMSESRRNQLQPVRVPTETELAVHHVDKLAPTGHLSVGPEDKVKDEEARKELELFVERTLSDILMPEGNEPKFTDTASQSSSFEDDTSIHLPLLPLTSSSFSTLMTPTPTRTTPTPTRTTPTRTTPTTPILRDTSSRQSFPRLPSRTSSLRDIPTMKDITEREDTEREDAKREDAKIEHSHREDSTRESTKSSLSSRRTSDGCLTVPAVSIQHIVLEHQHQLVHFPRVVPAPVPPDDPSAVVQSIDRQAETVPYRVGKAVPVERKHTDLPEKGQGSEAKREGGTEEEGSGGVKEASVWRPPRGAIRRPMFDEADLLQADGETEAFDLAQILLKKHNRTQLRSVKPPAKPMNKTRPIRRQPSRPPIPIKPIKPHKSKSSPQQRQIPRQKQSNGKHKANGGKTAKLSSLQSSKPKEAAKSRRLPVSASVSEKSSVEFADVAVGEDTPDGGIDADTPEEVNPQPEIIVKITQKSVPEEIEPTVRKRSPIKKRGPVKHHMCSAVSRELPEEVPVAKTPVTKSQDWIYDDDDLGTDVGEEDDGDSVLTVEPDLPEFPDLPTLTATDSPTRLKMKKLQHAVDTGVSRRWGPRRHDSSYRDDLERENLAEERRRHHAMMLERLQKKGFQQRMLEKGIGEIPNFEDYGFLAKYCILNRASIEMYKHAFQEVDVEKKGWLTGIDAMIALRGANSGLSMAEELYLYRILEHTGYSISHGADFKLFSVLAALSQRISSLDTWMKNLLGQVDFKILDMKMFLCKNLWECSVDPATNTISLDQLMVELRVGGVSYKHECEVRKKLENMTSLNLLDFLTYVPLFIMIHTAVVDNPLDDTRDK